MKQVLVIEVDGAVRDFVTLLLRPDAYDLTVVETPREALALVAYGSFDLVIIGRTHECPGAAWCFAQRIAELCLGRAAVLIHADEADDMLHARVAGLGACVLTAPGGSHGRAGNSGASRLFLGAKAIADTRERLDLPAARGP